MKKNVMKIVGIILVAVMMVSTFAGCGVSDVEKPEAVAVKTDLKDVNFTFTYGDLKNVLPGDQLATLFENTNKKLDSRTVQLSYYELVSKFGDKDYFANIIALISDEEMAAFTSNQQAILDYFNNSINDAKSNENAYVYYNENFWINHGGSEGTNEDGSVDYSKVTVFFKDTEGNLLDNQPELRAAFRLYSDMALQNIGAFLMNYSLVELEEEMKNVDFVQDKTNIIYPLGEKTASTLTLADLYTDTNQKTGIVTPPVYTSLTYTYVHDLDEDGNNAEYTEGELEGEYIFVPSEIYRTINIAVNPEEASVKKAFTVREKDGILEQFKVAENYLKVNSFEIAFNPCKISAGFNAVNDQMTYATYEKNMVITANVTFAGALAKYGTVVVEFPCTSSLTYNFGWNLEDKAE